MPIKYINSFYRFILVMFVFVFGSAISTQTIHADDGNFSTAFQKTVLYEKPSSTGDKSSSEETDTDDKESTDKVNAIVLRPGGKTSFSAEQVYLAEGNKKAGIKGASAFGTWLSSMSKYDYLQSKQAGFFDTTGKIHNLIALGMPGTLYKGVQGIYTGVTNLATMLQPSSLLYGNKGTTANNAIAKGFRKGIDSFTETLLGMKLNAAMHRVVAMSISVIVPGTLIIIMIQMVRGGNLPFLFKQLFTLLIKVMLIMITLEAGGIFSQMSDSANKYLNENDSITNQYIFNAESVAKGTNFYMPSYFNDGLQPNTNDGSYVNTKFSKNSEKVIKEANTLADKSLGNSNAEDSAISNYITGSTFTADDYLGSQYSAKNQGSRLNIPSGDNKSEIRNTLSKRIAGTTYSGKSLADVAGQVDNQVKGKDGQEASHEGTNDDKATYFNTTWGSHNGNTLSTASTYYLLNTEIKGDSSFTLIDPTTSLVKNQPTFKSSTIPAGKWGVLTSQLWSSAIVLILMTFLVFKLGFQYAIRGYKEIGSGIVGNYTGLIKALVTYMAFLVTISFARLMPVAVSEIVANVKTPLLAAFSVDGLPSAISGMLQGFLTFGVTVIIIAALFAPILGSDGWLEQGKPAIKSLSAKFSTKEK